jgi:hypothetical protein
MINIKTILLLSISMAFLSSCEKVVDLNLNDASARIVVEGSVSNSTSIGSLVILSNSKSVKSNNGNNPLSGAVVKIQEGVSTVYTLTETERGVYKNLNLVGKEDSIYKLTIQINGNTITAQSRMPKQIKFDSLIVEEFPNFGRTIKLVTPFYNDPVGLGNYYRFKIYKNSVQIRQSFVYDDSFIDGRKVTFPLVYNKEEDEFKKADIIDVEMFSIDEANYKYWFSLEMASNGSPQSAPANPISNIIGNAIGVFSANTYQTKRVVVP